MILLDPRIRDFVLLPIFLVVVLMSALRSSLMSIFKSENKVDMKEVKTNQMLTRCRMVKVHANMLRDQAYKSRRAYFIKKDHGVLVKNPPKTKDPMDALQAAQDPTMMMGMMKNQMLFMVSQGVLGYWVSHQFHGFLVAKTPFPLTFRIKNMLQRGVEVAALEAGYVSALSWYFFVQISSYPLIAFIQSLINRDVEAEGDPMSMMMGTMGGGASPMGGGPDMAKVYKQESEGLEILNYEFSLESIETELWRKWRQERVR
jgi:hypothetical protein